MIEMMIVVAILGIMIYPMTSMYLNARKFSEDHILFTRVSAALAQQAEIIKTIPYGNLKIGKGQKLNNDVEELIKDIEGVEGTIDITYMDISYGVKRVTIKVSWANSWEAQRSIHTVILRSAP